MEFKQNQENNISVLKEYLEGKIPEKKPWGVVVVEMRSRCKTRSDEFSDESISQKNIHQSPS